MHHSLSHMLQCGVARFGAWNFMRGRPRGMVQFGI
jgi:hypothetical protein